VLSNDPLLRAGVTLGFVVTAQASIMFIWLMLRDPNEIIRVLQTWRTGVWVGITSMGGSYMWFVAFTLQNAAYVKALGQVELIFSILASFIFFQGTDQQKRIHRNGADFSFCFGFDPDPLIRGGMAV
jgi:drug/metabolite transporter (DMT)-like permease